jgi:hypothetical protein
LFALSCMTVSDGARQYRLSAVGSAVSLSRGRRCIRRAWIPHKRSPWQNLGRLPGPPPPKFCREFTRPERVRQVFFVRVAPPPVATPFVTRSTTSARRVWKSDG